MFRNRSIRALAPAPAFLGSRAADSSPTEGGSCGGVHPLALLSVLLLCVLAAEPLIDRGRSALQSARSMRGAPEGAPALAVVREDLSRAARTAEAAAAGATNAAARAAEAEARAEAAELRSAAAAERAEAAEARVVGLEAALKEALGAAGASAHATGASAEGASGASAAGAPLRASGPLSPATPLRPSELGGGRAITPFAGPLLAGAYAPARDHFPALTLEPLEKPWFDMSLTNPAHVLSARPAGTAALASLPYPPGVPSLAAYHAAQASSTFAALARFSAAHARVNAVIYDTHPYEWGRTPLMAWSRQYEYVWHAEAVRAALPAAHAQSLAATWPDAPASAPADIHVLDAGSGFTFFDQFLASRAGVHVTALDQEASYVPLFGR